MNQSVSGMTFKTSFVPFLMLLLVFSHTAKADALGLFLGVSGWHADNTGDLQSGSEPVDVEKDLGLDTETLVQAYVAFDHFIPLIPNVRVQYSDLGYEGSGELNSRFDGVNFDGAVATDVDISQIDLIAYWRLLDNVLNLDLGLQVAKFDGDIGINQAEQSPNASTTSIDETIPMAYVSAGVDLPFIDLSLTGSLSTGSNTDSDATDLKISLNYEIDVIGAELGWRRLELELDDVSNVDADIELSGPYLGVSIHF